MPTIASLFVGIYISACEPSLCASCSKLAKFDDKLMYVMASLGLHHGLHLQRIVAMASSRWEVDDN